MEVTKWIVLLPVCFLLFCGDVTATENTIPDINNLSEPPIGAERSPEEDAIWCTPEQIHLSFGNTTNEMVVMWTTRGHCDTVVHYAAHPWNLDQMATGSSIELEKAAEKSLKFVHRVILKDLKPSTTYFFRPDLSSGVGAGPFYFMTPSSQDVNWSPHFLVVSNMDSDRSNMKTVINEALSGAYKVILYNGDLEDKLTPTAAATKDNTFLSTVQQAAALLPLMTAVGKKADGDDGLYWYRHIFSMPGSGWPMPEDKMWYSMDIGPVHLVSYSTEVLFELDPSRAKAQQDWLVKDLTEANKKRAQTPWVVAFGRQPMYCALGNQDIDECARNTSKVRHGLEDMFYHFAVDLVIESQHMAYERTWPQYKGVVVSKSYLQPRAPVEVIIGSQVGRKDPAVEKDANDTAAPLAEWSAYHLLHVSAHSYGRLSIMNASHLHWELMSSSSSSPGQSTLDSFWIVQDSHGNFSLANLPHNVSHQINQTIIAMGGKPGTYDFISGSTTSDDEGDGWSEYSLWLGLAVVAVVVVAVLGMVAIRSCLRKRRARGGRRWREMDRDGDGRDKFYSVGSESDTDDNDFEIDVYNKANKQSSKLLTSY